MVGLASIIFCMFRMVVIGSSRVAIYGARDRGDESFYFLSPGDVFDLSSRMRVTVQPTGGRD